MLLKTRDIKPRIFTVRLDEEVITNIDPIITIPEIAFVPDIKGVCNVGGIFFINSYPNSIAIMKIKIKYNSSFNFSLQIKIGRFNYFIIGI